MSDSTPITEKPKSRGNPNWVKGMKPVGGGITNFGLLPPGERTRFLLQKYGPAEIQRMAKNISKADVTTHDALLIKRIARALDDGLELERMHDRTFGKVPDKQINLNVNVEVEASQLSARALELLAKLSPEPIDAEPPDELSDLVE